MRKVLFGLAFAGLAVAAVSIVNVDSGAPWSWWSAGVIGGVLVAVGSALGISEADRGRAAP